MHEHAFSVGINFVCVCVMQAKLVKVGQKKSKPANNKRPTTKKSIDLTGRGVLIPGDIYNVSGWWYKGRVVGRAKNKRGRQIKSSWRVAFPPQVKTHVICVLLMLTLTSWSQSQC